ncbi:MAG TPA: phosphotransferase [Steroidobacteraceae bacterium]|nr:phosphotransferase [Steroidobacteraceae bacterium]
MANDLDAFMATMVAQSQPVPIDRALALARESYGLEADAIRLTGERDENFKLTARDGAQYVLKIANPAESAAVTDLQIAALLHLERTEATLPIPRIRRSLNGATQVRFEDAQGMERTARILTYLPGRLLAESVRSGAQRAACGRFGGRMSRALGSFQHAAAHRAVIWDVRHVGYLSRLLEQMPDFPYRAQATQLLARIVPRVDARLPAMRQQIVHNDLNPRNLLVDPAAESHLTGIIDFGDLTRTAVIADVGVAGAELIPPDCTDPLRARECVLEVARGYQECMPLLEGELAILGSLVAARLLMNVVVHEWHVHHNPASQHFAPLRPDFMRVQLELADRMSGEEFKL